MERATEPPASWSTVGCKPGHDSPLDTITETSVKGSDAINPQGLEKGKSHLDATIFVVPLFGRYSSSPGYSSVSKAYADVRGAYASRTQAYGVRTQYAVSTRPISSRVVSLWVLSRISQMSRSR